MKALLSVGLVVTSVAVVCVSASAQVYSSPNSSAQPTTGSPAPALTSSQGPVDLNWTPAALNSLSADATSKSSFSLDRNTIGLAAALVPDSEPETRQAIAKLDGVSVHMLRFGPAGIPDEAAVNDIRRAYHLRGWKHLVTNTAILPTSLDQPDGPHRKDPLHNGTTDLWLVMDGVNVRGGVALIESPRSLTLVTVAGNISPVDMLHLRGHFGIPRFDGDDFKNADGR